MERYLQKTTKYYTSVSSEGSYITQHTILQDIKRIETSKSECQREFTEFLISKKIQTTEEIILVEKKSKIKKSKKKQQPQTPKKCTHCTDAKIPITSIFNRLLEKYSTTISLNRVIWARSLQEKHSRKEIFITVLKYLEAECQNLRRQFQRQLREKYLQIDFGDFLDFENPIPNEFVAMIYRDFPQIKKYLEQFDRKLLSPDDWQHLRQLCGGAITVFMGFDQGDPEQLLKLQIEAEQKMCEIDFTLPDKDDDDGGDTSTSGEHKKKKKRNKKKKNKKNTNEDPQNGEKSQKLNRMLNDAFDEGQLGQNQIDKIISYECRVDDEAKYQELMNFISNLEIKDQDRLPCNVTQQWLEQSF